MKEDEAKTKWCPMVRHNDETGSWNRIWSRMKLWAGVDKEGNLNSHDMCNCIASDCAMWVKDELIKSENPPHAGQPAGHCGLIREASDSEQQNWPLLI